MNIKRWIWFFLLLVITMISHVDRREHRAGVGTCRARNVILIILDTVRADHLGCYGSRIDLTPEIDRFARGAMRFEKAFAHAPWTLPSVATLLTSRYPEQHGAGGHMGDFRSLCNTEVTLPELYRDSAYQTGAIINVMFLARKFGMSQGFTTVDEFEPKDNLSMRRAAPTTDAALRWLDDHAEDPFFLLVHYFDPHLIYDPPEPFRTHFADPRDVSGDDYLFGTSDEVMALHRRKTTLDQETIVRLSKLYMGEIAYLDHHVGRLLAGIASRGLDRNTVIVLTADHGEEFGDHGDFEHGHSLYDELVHIPLIVHIPDGALQVDEDPSTLPATVATTIGQIDIAPTLCELMGIAVSPRFEGRSLLPLLVGAQEPDRPILCQGNMWLGGGSSWRKGSFKLVRHSTAPEYQLFDVLSDPSEQVDLAEKEKERCAAMIQDMELIRQGFASESSPRKAARLSEQDRERLRSLGYIE